MFIIREILEHKLNRLLTPVLFILSSLYSHNSTSVTLEEGEVSVADVKAARNIRDSTQAPNSLVGGMAESVAKSIADGSRSNTESCQRGNCDSVMVDFDVVAGFSTEGVDRKFSMMPVNEGTGRVENNASNNGASIFKAHKSTLAGLYQWTASWNSNKKACSGKIFVSGKKRNVHIRVYSDCSDAGSN